MFTNDRNVDNQDQFYSTMPSVIVKGSIKDLTILTKDLNFKFRVDNKRYEVIIGRHGLGEEKKIKERFINICALNNLVIGGTIIPRKRIHKAIWISLDHNTDSQTYYI